jgi:hypothetical protein
MFTEWAALYMTCVFDDEVLWLLRQGRGWVVLVAVVDGTMRRVTWMDAFRSGSNI